MIAVCTCCRSLLLGRESALWIILNYILNIQPTGDQPQAIKELVEGFKEGNQFETLLGVTGSGKTFTMANVIAAAEQADADHCPQ